jgi:hypothetical protein
MSETIYSSYGNLRTTDQIACFSSQRFEFALLSTTIRMIHLYVVP